MKRFLIADSHFYHAKIIQYSGRPFKDETEMNEAIIHNWNSVVSNEDIIFHLGDVATRLEKEDMKKLISRLNGRKYLILGNHDYDKSDYVEFWMDCGFEFVSRWPIIIDEFYILSHQPLFLSDTDSLRMKKSNVVHCANIHGHIHQHSYKDPHYYNVSVEHHGYTPIEVEKAFKQIKDRCTT